MSVGKITGGNVRKIEIRVRSNASVDVGDILVAGNEEKYFMKIVDIGMQSTISSQFVEEMAGEGLEFDKDYNIFDAEERFYRIAKAKILKVKKNGKFVPARSIPNHFTEVRKISSDEFDFIEEGCSEENTVDIGNLRLGTESLEDVPIALPTKKLISHHMLVAAATGKGKSNFAKVFIRGLLPLENCASIIFDPHDEYYGGKGEKGLRDHPNRDKIMFFTPRYEKFPGSEKLEISVEGLKPTDFKGILDLSSAQKQAIDLAYREYGKSWVRDINDKKSEQIFQDFNEKINKSTIVTLKRKIQHGLELGEGGNSRKGLVFSLKENEDVSIYEKIKRAVKERKTIIIETSLVGEKSEKIVSSSVLRKIFESYRKVKQKDQEKFGELPETFVLFEEAPRVLSEEELSKGTNIFERIAREGRKFKIGLCAITQMPSLLPREILSQMNTKVILGLPSPSDRESVINSSAQNISDESTEIQMLDKGETIITSPFINFPFPAKIFLFEDILEKDKEETEDEGPPPVSVT